MRGVSPKLQTSDCEDNLETHRASACSKSDRMRAKQYGSGGIGAAPIVVFVQGSCRGVLLAPIVTKLEGLSGGCNRARPRVAGLLKKKGRMYRALASDSIGESEQ